MLIRIYSGLDLNWELNRNLKGFIMKPWRLSFSACRSRLQPSFQRIIFLVVGYYLSKLRH